MDHPPTRWLGFCVCTGQVANGLLWDVHANKQRIHVMSCLPVGAQTFLYGGVCVCVSVLVICKAKSKLSGQSLFDSDVGALTFIGCLNGC